MNEEMLREDLLASFQQLQKQFDSSLNDAKTLDIKFVSRYQQFHTTLSDLLADARIKLPASSPLNVSLTEFINGLESLDKAWKTKLENQDKGLSFRKNFEDSLLVYVYGKVKSGKSSLGNYIAWGYTDPTPEQQNGKKHDYQTYENSNAENGDAYNEAEQQAKFRVGATEATSSIQSFRLPGLTWVDSPGLHSVRTENGKLAKEHADHADLILYTMKSSAPGRASDLKEIRDLYSKEKNIMLLLTSSDKKVHGWDSEKNEATERCVMKSAQDRQLQRDYVKKELQELNLDISNIEILSLSARYAELNADNSEAINESGMGQLFATLHQISQARGVRMKRAVPMTNFKNFLTGCISDLTEYHKLTGSFTQELAKLRAGLPKQMVPAIREAQARMRADIQATFDTLAAGRDDESQVNAALTKSKSTWDSQMEKWIDSALNTILAGVMNEFKATIAAAWKTSSLSLPTFSVEKVINQIPDGYIKGTRNRNSGIGGLIGGGLGLLLGPVGLAVGASIGAGLGAMTGNSSRPDMRNIEVAVGDNLNDLRTRVLDIYNERIEKEIQLQVDTHFSALLRDMSDSCSTLETEIRDFKTTLTVLKKHAEDTLIKEIG